MPEAVARKVIMAASRCSSSCSTASRLAVIAPISATPARMATSDLDSAANSSTIAPENSPPSR
ncbi:hypothetical protein D3C78_1768330 [compost metagenome]